ncbi:MAG: hypothetical protein KC996_12185 [Phycisphaerales bacterium]|nr:hypothetical protein [Phycisphaerales bacterium]
MNRSNLASPTDDEDEPGEPSYDSGVRLFHCPEWLMLKFIRKYQLFILVIGGSLLMVVFLLQPILTKLSPNPAKAKIATLESGKKITSGDRQMAGFELEVVSRIYPRLMAPLAQGGIGITPVESDQSMHWYLLTKQAMDAGLVGDAADGLNWISIIAQREAYAQTRQELMQGLITEVTPEERMNELTQLLTATLTRNANSAAGMIPGYTQDDVYRSIAKARGIERLKSIYEGIPAFSDLGAIQAAHLSFDAIAVNATLIPGALLADSIADPTEEQLQAFFDEYKDQFPGQSDFGVGYQQPTRVKLAYLMLDRNTFMNAVQIDRVELVKIKTQNPDTYPGDFASERLKIERKYREDKSNEMLIEADRVIRAQVLASTRGLPSEEGVFELPEDWENRRPKLEQIAQAVADSISEQFHVNIPTPTINVYANAWMDASEMSALEGYGTANYRIGNQQFPTYAIPAILTAEKNPGLNIQPGLPLADPPATDQIGNRYYATVLEINDAGPADSIDDAGRQRVINDYKAIRGYEQLIAHTDELKAKLAETGDLQDAINAALALAPEDATAPATLQNILVRRDTIDRGRLTPSVNPGLNTESFRSAVLHAAAGIDQLAAPDSIPNADRAIAVPLPASKSLALATIVAPRPMTTEQFRAQYGQVIQSETMAEFVEANDSQTYPFSYESLTKRFGLVMLKEKSDDDSEPAAGS